MGLRSHLDEEGRPRIVTRRFVVEVECAGLRLDHFLKRKIPRLSRTKLQQIIRTQVVREDGRKVKPNSVVSEGDVLVLSREAKAEPPCPRTFGVLYRDDRMLIIDKPAGLPVHASAKYYFNTLTRVLSERYPDEKVQICHRLDKETSGALVVARDKAAAAVLKDAFAKKRVRKTYQAIVYGTPRWQPDHVIDAPLGLVEGDDALIDIRMEVRTDALPSQTRVRVLRTADEYSLVECEPITGRQHQIRAHLAHAGHPIVGDKLYAHGDEVFARCCDEGVDDEMLALLRLPRHALHAASITVPHPDTREPLTVEAPLAEELRAFLDR